MNLNYIKSMAIWSLIGYYIGLGDRHCDNILIHQDSGKIFHIDYDCIFEKGKKLPIPERLSFRLTKNVEAALGSFKAHGLFRYYMIELSKFFSKNCENIIGALDSFVHDPLLENG